MNYHLGKRIDNNTINLTKKFIIKIILDNYVETFLKQINLNQPCILKDSIKIIESFSNSYNVKLYGDIGKISVRKLVERINWNFQELSISFSQFITSSIEKSPFLGLPSIILCRFKNIFVAQLASIFHDIISEFLRIEKLSGLQHLKLDQRIKRIQDKVSFVLTSDEFEGLLLEQYTKIM